MTFIGAAIASARVHARARSRAVPRQRRRRDARRRLDDDARGHVGRDAPLLVVVEVVVRVDSPEADARRPRVLLVPVVVERDGDVDVGGSVVPAADEDAVVVVEEVAPGNCDVARPVRDVDEAVGRGVEGAVVDPDVGAVEDRERVAAAVDGAGEADVLDDDVRPSLDPDRADGDHRAVADAEDRLVGRDVVVADAEDRLVGRDVVGRR
jgi:hypothetical protein